MDAQSERLFAARWPTAVTTRGAARRRVLTSAVTAVSEGSLMDNSGSKSVKSAVGPGLYAVCRIDLMSGRTYEVARFHLDSAREVSFPSSADRLNASIIPPGPMSNYTFNRFCRLLECAEGTAGTHVRRLSEVN